MAFDTIQKRGDVLNWLQPSQIPLVIADSNLETSDGQTILKLYSGLTAPTPVPAVTRRSGLLLGVY